MDEVAGQIAALAHEHRERAYMAALGMLRDPEAAQDAVQEATARSLHAAARFERGALFYPWFYRILKNHCLDLLRHRRRAPEDGGEAVERLQASTETDAPLLSQERDAAVQRALAQISESHREILQLRHWQELSYDEISAILEVPMGTVMSRLYRARRALQDALDADPRWTP
jgi:RNA polymerase sigma-70 factor (ECF subfamily)